MEIRIYYESLEQGKHLIFDELKNLYPNIPIKLVYQSKININKEGVFNKNYSKNLAKILTKKNPDIIISIIKNNIEYPLSIIEFSTAVFTKDHEQQRSDNFQIPKNLNVFYIKVSPNKKKSPSDVKGGHGGSTNYNYLEPYSLMLKNYNKLTFHIDWSVDKKDNSKLIKHEKYKSIPPISKKLTELLNLIIDSFLESDCEKYEDLVINKCKENIYFSDWINSLKNNEDFEEIMNLNSSRTRWINFNEDLNQKNIFLIKFNRFGHAMDPERGMLNHYSTLFKTEDIFFLTEMILDREKKSWYPTSENNKKRIQNIFDNNEKITSKQLVEIFSIGINLPNQKIFMNQFIDEDFKTFDISKYINDNFLNLNSPSKTIFLLSNAIHLTDGRDLSIYLKWKVEDIDYDYKSLPDITKIGKKDINNEDDVSYIIANEVLIANDIKTLSVSYPGAQSDEPFLPENNLGRKQKRQFLDVVGLSFNDKSGKKLLLQENKSKFSESIIKKDIEKILLFKQKSNFIQSVVDWSKNRGINYNSMVIGIGFIYNEKYRENLDLFKGIDYLIIIKPLKWEIKVLNKNISFKKISGNINSYNAFEVL